MHKFTEGYFYHFKSMHDHALFTRRCGDNRAFANFVGGRPFKVLETDDYGNAQVVENHAEERTQIHLDAVNELTHFEINYDMAWCVNAAYQLKDAAALLKGSSINIQFIREIGYNPFIVESVCMSGVYDLKTMRLKYMDPDNRANHKYLNFTLTPDELEHFEEWKRPICSGFIRGESIVRDLPKRDNKFNLGKCDEIQMPTTGWVDEQIEEQEKDRGQTDAEIMAEIARDVAELTPESPKIEVKGKIRFVVEDEITRLKAIEFLNNMVFK